jgi:hypothetical protein
MTLKMSIELYCCEIFIGDFDFDCDCLIVSIIAKIECERDQSDENMAILPLVIVTGCSCARGRRGRAAKD